MILAVYGEDGYRVREHVLMLKTRFQDKHDSSGMNVSDIVFDKNEGEVVSAIGAMPFMAKQRMIIIRGLATSITTKKDAKVWTARLAAKEDTVIVLVDYLPVAKMAKNKLLAELYAAEDVHSYPFGLMNNAESRAWLKQSIADTGRVWDADAVSELIQRVGPDTWRLSHAVHQTSFAVASGASVSREDVQAQVSSSFEDTLFAFLDSIRQGDSHKALQLLQNERARGTAPEQLIRLLAREVKLLSELRAFAALNGKQSTQAAARELGVHPFVAKKMMPRAISIGADELRIMISAVLDADFRVKQTSMQSNEILDQLVLELLSPVTV
jgi:DNA polymerase III subunit delta